MEEASDLLGVISTPEDSFVSQNDPMKVSKRQSELHSKQELKRIQQVVAGVPKQTSSQLTR